MYPAFVSWFNGTRGSVFHVREWQDIFCHIHDFSIAAVYSPRRAAWLHLAR
jgi:cold shock CspA family protein